MKLKEFRRKHRSGLVTRLFFDIVGSTQLKPILGETAGVALVLDWPYYRRSDGTRPSEIGRTKIDLFRGGNGGKVKCEYARH